MICSLLAYKYPEKLDIDTAFSFYGDRRTMDGKGVTIPSQIRFANYFVSVMPALKDGSWLNHRDCVKELVSIQISSPPKIFSGWYVISTLIDEKVKTYEMDKDSVKKYKDSSLITIPVNCIVNRETKVSFFTEDSKAKPIFYFWFHSKFISNKLELDKRSLDKLKDKELYDAEFRVILNFTDINPAEIQNKLQSPEPVKRGSSRKDLVNSILRVKNGQETTPKLSEIFQTAPTKKSSDPPPSTNTHTSPQPAITSTLLDEYIEKKNLNEVTLPALNSEDTSTSESTESFSSDYDDSGIDDTFSSSAAHENEDSKSHNSLGQE